MTCIEYRFIVIKLKAVQELDYHLAVREVLRIGGCHWQEEKEVHWYLVAISGTITDHFYSESKVRPKVPTGTILRISSKLGFSKENTRKGNKS